MQKKILWLFFWYCVRFALSLDKMGGTRDNKIKNCVFILILLSFALSLHIKLYNYEI